MNVLVTGCAGFIGMHATQALLDSGAQVFGLDNLNDYYDVSLKNDRLQKLITHSSFKFQKVDIADLQAVKLALGDWIPHKVLHLAAQPGVRFSIDHPHVYAQSNLVAFLNILELCRFWKVEHLAYASSSSVYGLNSQLPFSETDPVEQPVSLYAATKRSNELMAYTYSHLYQLPTTGLRFFTVFGPWGRPDMAPFKFLKSMLLGERISVFNHGQQMRDFTYVDDIVKSTVAVLFKPPREKLPNAPYHVLNIGNADPVPLMDFIGTLESIVGRPAEKEFLPAQPGDVTATYANTQALRDWIGFTPHTPLSQGLQAFADWYREYYSA